MKKIRNLTTSTTFKQKEDFLISLKAKKRFYLQQTDWTQLKDVPLRNDTELLEWRKKLRNFKIDEKADGSTKKELEKIIAEQPTPNISYNTNQDDTIGDVSIDKFLDLERELNNLNDKIEYTNKPQEQNEIELLSLEECEEQLKKCFNKYKANELIENGGVVEYNLKKIMLEEAVERKLSNGKSNTPLLDQDSTDHSETELDKIINDCKEYFKNINELYTRLNKEERSLYNMNSTEINEWFESHGHRYRCKD
jgi:hypothetical protein